MIAVRPVVVPARSTARQDRQIDILQEVADHSFPLHPTRAEMDR
jgi:hypothetical protein